MPYFSPVNSRVHFLAKNLEFSIGHLRPKKFLIYSFDEVFREQFGVNAFHLNPYDSPPKIITHHTYEPHLQEPKTLLRLIAAKLIELYPL